MQYAEQPILKPSPKPHKLVLEDRHLLTAGGILDVENFDDGKIEAKTEYGGLIIEGENLHIVRLMVENGELVVEGNIGGIAYIEKRMTPQDSSGGFFSRLMR